MPTAEVGIAQSLNEALGLTFIDTAPESDLALSVSPSIGSRPFELPEEDGQPILIFPGWRLHFYDAESGLPVDVYADSSFTLVHARPVKVDRFGNLPLMYLGEGPRYRIVIENEFGVFKREVFTGNPSSPVVGGFAIDPNIYTSEFEIQPNTRYSVDTSNGAFQAFVSSQFVYGDKFRIQDANASFTGVNSFTVNFSDSGYLYNGNSQNYEANIPNDGESFVIRDPNYGFEIL